MSNSESSMYIGNCFYEPDGGIRYLDYNDGLCKQECFLQEVLEKCEYANKYLKKKKIIIIMVTIVNREIYYVPGLIQS